MNPFRRAAPKSPSRRWLENVRHGRAQRIASTVRVPRVAAVCGIQVQAIDALVVPVKDFERTIAEVLGAENHEVLLAGGERETADAGDGHQAAAPGQ